MGKQHSETEERDNRKYNKLFRIVIIILCMWFATIGGFIYYFFNTETKVESFDFNTEGGGNANYIGYDGDAYN